MVEAQLVENDISIPKILGLNPIGIRPFFFSFSSKNHLAEIDTFANVRISNFTNIQILS